MIRIVERHDRKHIFYYTNSKGEDVKPYYFEINKEIKSIYPCKNEGQETYPANIEIYDDIGRMFAIIQKPPVTTYGLGARIADVREDVLQEFFDIGVPRDDLIYNSVCCVDPRIIMVHALVWWRCTYNDEEKMKLLGEAFTPPPSYEEAEKWLIDNQFIGENALHENGYPGRAVYAFKKPKTFKNLPEKYIQAVDKICELIKNDDTMPKEEKEYWIKAWRIPKE